MGICSHLPALPWSLPQTIHGPPLPVTAQLRQHQAKTSPSQPAPPVLLDSGSPGPAGHPPPLPQLSLCPKLPSPKKPSLPNPNTLSSDPGSTLNSSAQPPSEAQKWAQSFIEGPTSQMQWEGDLIAPRTELQARTLHPKHSGGWLGTRRQALGEPWPADTGDLSSV